MVSKKILISGIFASFICVTLAITTSYIINTHIDGDYGTILNCIVYVPNYTCRGVWQCRSLHGRGKPDGMVTFSRWELSSFVSNPTVSEPFARGRRVDSTRHVFPVRSPIRAPRANGSFDTRTVNSLFTKIYPVLYINTL